MEAKWVSVATFTDSNDDYDQAILIDSHGRAFSFHDGRDAGEKFNRLPDPPPIEDEPTPEATRLDEWPTEVPEGEWVWRLPNGAIKYVGAFCFDDEVGVAFDALGLPPIPDSFFSRGECFTKVQ